MLAQRIPAQHFPRPRKTAQLNGLRYERRVRKQLEKQGYTIHHNPWYFYTDERSGVSKICCPDIILPHHHGKTYIIECKYTYTIEAIDQLDLYTKVIHKAGGYIPIYKPLIIYKISTPEASRSPFPTLQWLGYGPILLPE